MIAKIQFKDNSSYNKELELDSFDTDAFYNLLDETFDMGKYVGHDLLLRVKDPDEFNENDDNIFYGDFVPNKTYVLNTCWYGDMATVWEDMNVATFIIKE